MLSANANKATEPLVRYHELMRVCNRVNFHAPPVQLHGHRLTPGFIFCVEGAAGIERPIEDAGYCLNCCVAGSGRMTRPEAWPLQPGAVVVKLPTVEPHWVADAGGLLRFYICFSITPEIIPPLTPPRMLWPWMVQEVVTMTEECRLNLPGWPERAGMRCSMLVSRCATLLGAFSKPPPAPAYTPFLRENVEKYIITNLGLPIRLEDIAEYLGISERTLIRRYADETGQTVKARVLSLRMEKACILLRSTPLPLSDIAAQCGFQYVNHFIRAFHQYMGQTPRTYRLAGQQKET